MANQIIPADQVGTVVYNQLVASVEKTMEGASQEEKNLALYHILEAMSRSWFHWPIRSTIRWMVAKASEMPYNPFHVKSKRKQNEIGIKNEIYWFWYYFHHLPSRCGYGTGNLPPF